MVGEKIYGVYFLYVYYYVSFKNSGKSVVRLFDRSVNGFGGNIFSLFFSFLQCKVPGPFCNDQQL